MKKIISILCTLAMMLSMAVVASADANNYISWELISKEGGNAVLEAKLVTNQSITACPSYWDFSDATAKGATNITIEKVDASIASYTAANSMVMLNKASAEAYGSITLAKVTVEGISQNFTIKLMPSAGRTTTKITNADKTVITDSFTFADATFTLVEEEEKTEWTSEDNATIAADKKIVAHSENVTGVTADSKVTVTVDGESKTFGNGLGAYFAEKGIDLEGVADLAFRFAVLVDKAVESVSFVIE